MGIGQKVKNIKKFMNIIGNRQSIMRVIATSEE